MPTERTIRDANEAFEEKTALEQPDWDDIEGATGLADEMDENDEPTGELPEEDDDNPDQESDEALPDDLEERVLYKDPSKESERFGEV